MPYKNLEDKRRNGRERYLLKRGEKIAYAKAVYQRKKEVLQAKRDAQKKARVEYNLIRWPLCAPLLLKIASLLVECLPAAIKKERDYRKAFRQSEKSILWRIKNRAKLNKKGKIWREKNRSKLKAVSCKNYRKNPQYEKARRTSYYQRNRDRLLLRQQDFRKSNPEVMRDRRRKIYLKDPEKAKLHSDKRRALKSKSAIGDIRVIYKWRKTWINLPAVRCYWCLFFFDPKTCDMDHIIPLSKHGVHAVDNLCISCEPCNLRKRNKSLSEWNLEIEQPVLF